MSDLRQQLLAKKRAEAANPPNLGATGELIENLRPQTPDADPSPDEIGIRTQHPNSRANLIPAKKGQILNPEGKNQYSAGQSYRDSLEKFWLSDPLNNAEEINPDDYKGAVCLNCGLRVCDLHLGFDIYAHNRCLPDLENLAPIELIALQERCLALRGDEKAREHFRKTFNPASKQIELSTNPDKPFAVTTITRKIIKA